MTHPFSAPRRTTLIASLGAGLEYYDFVVYALLAPFLRTAFFSQGDSHLSTLEALSLFAVGYIARPVGGVLFGSRGDRHGRKTTFLFTSGLMALTTLAIGFLPTYARIGAAAPVLLVTLRCLQGLSLGGELPSAITFVFEHTDSARHGQSCSAVVASITFGSLLATVLLQCLTAWLDAEAMAQWGWRVAFWSGGSLAIAILFVRYTVQESPLFVAQTRPMLAPLRQVLSEQPRAILRGIALAFLGASLVIFPLYAPVYLGQQYGYAAHDVYTATTISIAWAAVATLAAGRLADRWGPAVLYRRAALLFMLAVPGLFLLLPHGRPSTVILFSLVWQTATAAVVGSYFVMLARAFPTAVRTTGIAVCYNTAFALAGLLPALFSQLTGTLPDATVGVIIVYALIALCAWAAAKR